MGHNLSNKIKILSWNCQSVRNKTIELQHHLESNNIDVAVICETWLTSNHQFNLNNYTIYRKDRVSGVHGGVAIAIK